jgi:HSP20 family protein
MDLIRWRNGSSDLFPEFETLQDEINRLFDLSRVPEPRGIFERTFSPAVDIIESADGYEVLCDVPGLEIKDIEISLSGSVLTLKGEKRTSEMGKPGDTFREETAEGLFQRTLQLPTIVDADKVDAVLKDGVLRIVLPKHEVVKPRTIAVTAQ